MASQTIVYSSFLICLVTFPCYSQFPPKKTYQVIKEDLPHVQCDVCQKTVRHLFKKTLDMREKAPAKKLEEEKILNEVEKVCNPDSEQGDWITKLDIIEKDNKLKTEEHTEYGKCKGECKTVARACEETVSDVDTDLAELLWKNKHTLSQLINEVCYDLSSACKVKTGPLKKKRSWDETFEVMTEEERKANEMMKKMSGVPGMPGMNMYSREEIEKMRDSMKDAEDSQAKPQAPLYSENLGFFQTIVDSLRRLWEWLKSLFTPHSTSEL